MANKQTNQSIEQLRADLATKQADLDQAKTGLAAGELANPRVIRALRKDIARIKTAIRAGELAQTKEDN